MAEVTLTINGRNYTVACEDGQEPHLRNLAAHIDECVGDMAETVGQVGESRLLVMAGLMVADELADAYGRISELEGAVAAQPTPDNGAGDPGVSVALETCANRLEAIATRLEQS